MFSRFYVFSDKNNELEAYDTKCLKKKITRAFMLIFKFNTAESESKDARQAINVNSRLIDRYLSNLVWQSRNNVRQG